ncbi:hypothetical protein PV08_06486 [Exophiala spinifera]|uniref:Phospholipase/carboxylesterase/thioesterase domain-containing protein n=1 Tax=Exophiala spinifera TaxID=91928 RepID=A0A0D2BYP6_9EURO|nr:uncharacterized protein PV08_06486 [Exophiala spinifera]KIW16434.1 hypothetical protein PV08_06486 [Exophiala spinifera]
MATPKRTTGKMGHPEPLVVLPSATHTFSIILLHGRGSNGPRFGLEFLESRTSGGQTLQELFPSVKFIFPTAKKRRSTVLKRVKINQWFDNYSLDDPTERQDLQYEGLTETTQFLHQLIEEEGTTLQGGVNNVIVGGLSQGGAMALIASLSFAAEDHHDSSFSKQVEAASKDAATASTTSSYRGSSLGGFIGMSGWLPFARDIVSAALPNNPDGNDDEYDDHSDPFVRTSSDSHTVLSEETRAPRGPDAEDSISNRLLRAANFARDLVDLEPLQGRVMQDEQKVEMTPREERPNSMPYFLGHGVLDEKVSVHLGTQIRDVLLQLGRDVTWKQYDDLGHWYKTPDELDNIANFLQEKVGMV